MTDITVRRAGRADIAQVIRLRWDVCVEQGVADPNDVDLYRRYERALRDFLDRYIEDDQCWIVVAADGDRIVATSTLWLTPVLPWPGGLNEWHGYVTNVYTIPPYRRRGIARRLMETLREIATQREVSVLQLETTPESEPLYREMGFVPSRIQELRLTGGPADGSTGS